MRLAGIHQRELPAVRARSAGLHLHRPGGAASVRLTTAVRLMLDLGVEQLWAGRPGPGGRGHVRTLVD